MAEKPEDLNLPNSVVFRLIKEEIPTGIIVAKDVRLAISKAASVFVLYCTATANAVAQAANRKTLSGTDVIAAVEEMEFEEFKPALQTFLREYKETHASKKQKKSPAKGAAAHTTTAGGSPSTSKGKPGPKKSSPFKEPRPAAPIRIDDSDDEPAGDPRRPASASYHSPPADFRHPIDHSIPERMDDDVVVID